MVRVGQFFALLAVACGLVPPGPRRAVDKSLEARVVAFKVLEQASKEVAPTEDLLARLGGGLSDQDRTFAKRLVLTTQRHSGEIDAAIGNHCRRRPKGATLVALRLGITQLLFCDGVPPRAAVHTSVEVCKRFRGSDKLVNGVLRTIDRARPAAGDAAAPAASVNAAPWLFEALEADHGGEVAARYVERCVAAPPDRLDVTCASEAARGSASEMSPKPAARAASTYSGGCSKAGSPNDAVEEDATPFF